MTIMKQIRAAALGASVLAAPAATLLVTNFTATNAIAQTTKLSGPKLAILNDIPVGRGSKSFDKLEGFFLDGDGADELVLDSGQKVLWAGEFDGPNLKRFAIVFKDSEGVTRIAGYLPKTQYTEGSFSVDSVKVDGSRIDKCMSTCTEGVAITDLNRGRIFSEAINITTEVTRKLEEMAKQYGLDDDMRVVGSVARSSRPSP